MKVFYGAWICGGTAVVSNNYADLYCSYCGATGIRAHANAKLGLTGVSGRPICQACNGEGGTKNTKCDHGIEKSHKYCGHKSGSTWFTTSH